MDSDGEIFAAWGVVLLVCGGLVGTRYLGEWVAWAAVALVVVGLVAYVAWPTDSRTR